MENGLADCVVHIDTGIGIPQTKEYVIDRCREHEWPLVIITSDFNYEEIVLENKFPGPGVHIIMYSKLKERAFREVPRHIDAKPNFHTGVRMDESDRRFKNVSQVKKTTSGCGKHRFGTTPPGRLKTILKTTG
jgi:3'-phosphoadenosine 5'-phosphosulfate sulfotransferase (PAPS reductase)/FAD synthetase